MGKGVCEDLCSGGSSCLCQTGPVLNPHDKTRSAGGSSSGVGVLVNYGCKCSNYMSKLASNYNYYGEWARIFDTVHAQCWIFRSGSLGLTPPPLGQKITSSILNFPEANPSRSGPLNVKTATLLHFIITFRYYNSSTPSNGIVWCPQQD